jgi:hypothetical protein
MNELNKTNKLQSAKDKAYTLGGELLRVLPANHPALECLRDVINELNNEQEVALSSYVYNTLPGME